MDTQLRELTESLKSVFDLTSRIDERLKSLIESNSESKERIEKLVDNQTTMLNRLTVLENKNYSSEITLLKNNIDVLEAQVDSIVNRVSSIENSIESHTTKWTMILDFAFKIAVVVISGIILWKMGIKP